MRRSETNATTCYEARAQVHCFTVQAVPSDLGGARLIEPRRHEKTQQMRSEASEISFHSLRHNAVTMLKAADVSDFMAREIVGHERRATLAAIHSPYNARQAAAIEDCQM